MPEPTTAPPETKTKPPLTNLLLGSPFPEEGRNDPPFPKAIWLMTTQELIAEVQALTRIAERALAQAGHLQKTITISHQKGRERAIKRAERKERARVALTACRAYLHAMDAALDGNMNIYELRASAPQLTHLIDLALDRAPSITTGAFAGGTMPEQNQQLRDFTRNLNSLDQPAMLEFGRAWVDVAKEKGIPIDRVQPIIDNAYGEHTRSTART